MQAAAHGVGAAHIEAHIGLSHAPYVLYFLSIPAELVSRAQGASASLYAVYLYAVYLACVCPPAMCRAPNYQLRVKNTHACGNRNNVWCSVAP